MNLTGDLRVPSGQVPFYGAPELIAQMLDKLCANAVEFAAPATPIIVTLEHEENAVALAVANEGPPLPAKMQGRLFDSMVSVLPHVQGGRVRGLLAPREVARQGARCSCVVARPRRAARQ